MTFTPGLDNVEADRASRVFHDNVEWALNPKHFEKACKVFGKPDIDLFASRLNYKCHHYISWLPDPQAEAVNAFSMTWRGLNAYGFPPFSLIQRTLNKLARDKVHTMILVTPTWTTKSWWRIASSKFQEKEETYYHTGTNCSQISF